MATTAELLIELKEKITTLGEIALNAGDIWINPNTQEYYKKYMEYNIEVVPSMKNCKNLTECRLLSGCNRIQSGGFSYCTSLTTIYLAKSLNLLAGSNQFLGSNNLEFVTFEDGFNLNKLNLSYSTKYSVVTIVNMLTALADRTGLTAYTLTLGSTNLKKLTEEQIAIATSKNWTLA